MRIRPNQVFLDDVDRFEPDQTYDVDDGRGYYFCKMGWADNLDEEVKADPQPEIVDLDVQNSTVGMKDSNG